MLNAQFSHEAKELSAFTFSLDTFIISLKNGKVVKHMPDNVKAFREWLEKNNVREVGKRATAGALP